VDFLSLTRMTDEVRRLTHAEPFVAFLIKTSDGKQYRVKHPDYVAISPKGGRATVYADEENEHHAERPAHGRRGTAGAARARALGFPRSQAEGLGTHPSGEAVLPWWGGRRSGSGLSPRSGASATQLTARLASL